MSSKDTLRNGMRGSLGRYGANGKPKGTRSSRAYDRHFEGYTKVSLPGGVRRVYTAAYYKLGWPLYQEVALRMTYVSLLLVGGWLFCATASQPLRVNTCQWVIAVQAVVIGLMAWMATALLSYITLYGQLTIGEYRRTALKLKKASPCASAGFAALSVASFVAILLSPEEVPGALWRVPLTYLICAVLLLLPSLIERRLPYRTVHGESFITDAVGNEDALTVISPEGLNALSSNRES